MRRILAILAAASLVLVIAVPPAAATTTRHEIACEEHLVATLVAPREWVDEYGVYHIRGLVNQYAEHGGPRCSGTNVAEINVNLDLATGEGIVWAKGHITLAGGGGGWDGRLVAHFTPGGPYIWEGTIVMQGWGSLAGWQRRAEIVEPNHFMTVYTGVDFLAGD
jgi:hypothetical protein